MRMSWGLQTNDQTIICHIEMCSRARIFVLHLHFVCINEPPLRAMQKKKLYVCTVCLNINIPFYPLLIGCFSTPDVGRLHGGVFPDRNQCFPQEVHVQQCCDTRLVGWTHQSLGWPCACWSKGEDGYVSFSDNIISRIMKIVIHRSLQEFDLL